MRGSTPLVAVVVTFNRLPQLRQTLAALLAHPPEVLGAVMVVDNASTDGSADWLGSCLDARLRVERLARNVGGAGGFAHGLARAQAVYDPDWIVVMDDDARPAPGALAQFHALLRQGALQGLDAVAAAVRHPDGRICRMNRPTVNPFWHGGVFLRTLLGGGRAAFHLADAAYAEGGLRPVDGASFVGLFLSRRALSLAGLPDPALFLYADDAIYTMTLTRRGGRMGFAPQIRFVHDSDSLGAGGVVRPLWKVYYYHRNRLLLYRLAAGAAFWLMLPLWLIQWPRQARHYAAEERVAFRRVLRRAVRDALRRDLSLPHAEVLRLAEGGQR
ncbi:glycosyltransferase [Pseudorhodobacter sp. MZDSW-24AT]|uniref:glycosyltransferase n=1 Tax=Pseudorhodobacter sp. MZDSW-24AT TaxID=2052957 RepID=UPI000C1DEA86|nr:glycosyltransferase [Pseudorhodobacter sp. MZDSW-24AT]PJF11314.1 glycosyltransferase [Pseudorhodobacter sp. MZDSW-24AT]